MMTNSNADGVDKVLASRGTYVYIMESASVDYEVKKTNLNPDHINPFKDICFFAKKNVFVIEAVLFIGCPKLPTDPGGEDVLASQLWSRFGSR